MTAEDRELERPIEALRREDLEHVPPFQVVWNAAHERRRPLRPVASWAAATAAGLLIAVLALLPRGPAPQRAPEMRVSIVEWKSPTEFLLDTPGRELLAATPAVGEGLSPALELSPPTPSPPASRKGGTS